MKKILIILTAAVLAACSKPTVDASSEEALETSLQTVRDSLPEHSRSDFDAAIAQVFASNIGTLFGAAFSGDAVDAMDVVQQLHGKTGEEVIAVAQALREERAARERAQAIEEIAELEARRVEAERAKEELAAFEVLRSRFYKREREFLGEEPVIELSVRNGTSYPISRASFAGTIASPGRSVPWFKDSFSYSIPGGLEPGEEAEWRLAPNMFSDWGRIDAPEDAVFTVEVTRLDGPDGEKLFSLNAFDEEDAARLDALRREYGTQ